MLVAPVVMAVLAALAETGATAVFRLPVMEESVATVLQAVPVVWLAAAAPAEP